MRFLRMALLVGIVSLVCGAWAGVAWAQTSPESEFSPKNFAMIDGHGVDVADRKYNASHSISIGDPKNGGMSYSVFYSGGMWRFYSSVLSFVRFDYQQDPDTQLEFNARSLQFMGKTEQLDWPPGPASSEVMGDLGSRMTLCGVSYCGSNATLSDGTLLTFETTGILVYYGGIDTGTIYRVLSAVKPNGDRLNFHYNSSSLGPISITNNHGYQLRYEYPGGAPSSYALINPSSVVLINMAIDACNPDASSCTYTRPWPRLSFAYGQSGLSAVTETGGAITTYQYGPSSHLIEHVDGPGTRHVDITYQDCGANPPNGTCPSGGDILGGFRVTSVSSGGRTWNYAWVTGLGGTGTRVTSAAGIVTYVSSVASSVGAPPFTTFASSVKKITDEIGRSTSIEYVGVLNPQASKITYPEGNYDQYSYDQRMNVSSITHVAKPGSTLPNQVIQIQRGESGNTPTCIQSAYCNKPVLVRDARGFVNRRTWDTTTGVLLSTETGLTGPDTNLTCWFGTALCPKTTFIYTAKNAYYYNAAGQLAAGPSILLPTTSAQCETVSTCAASAQVVTTMNYGLTGSANNLLLASFSVGKGSQVRTSSFTYDGVGNRIQVDGPRTDVADIIRFTWDDDRRPLDEINADNSGTHKIYSPEGYLQSVTRGVFNSSNQLVTAFETVTNTYDVSGNLLRAVGPAGVTEYSYDGVNRLLCTATRMNPDVYANALDACSLATQGAYGPDRITHNVYDAAGQVLKIQRAYGTPLQQDYASIAYTANGKQDWVDDANGNRSDFSYDGFDRLTQLNFPQTTIGTHAANPTDYEGYGYDSGNNRTSLRLRSGETLNYTYDALNRETLRDIPGGTAQDVYTSYDLLNRKTAAQYQSVGGQGVSYSYDPWGGVLTESSYGRTLTFTYDEAGNRSTLTWPSPDTNYIQYTYDAMNRMAQVRENGAGSGTGLLAQYSYDVLGRRATIIRGNGTSTTIAYDGASRLQSLTQDLASTVQDLNFGFVYNPASQMITRTISNQAIYGYVPASTPTSTYVPDGLNRYASVGGVAFSYDPRGNLTNNGVRAYSYDLENHLTQVNGASGSPSQLTLDYDPLGRLRQTTSPTATTQFSNAGDQLVAEFDASGTLLRRYVPGAGLDEPLVWYEGSSLSSATRRWLFTDHQGSIVGASNDAGALVGSAYSYSPYGEPDATNGWSGSRFRYTGQTTLPEVKLYYYKARIYDPTLGRFLQTDPIGYKDDYDLYSYVGNDPMDKTDPTGTICTQNANASGPSCKIDFVNVGTAKQPNWVSRADGIKSGKVSEKQLGRLEGNITKAYVAAQKLGKDTVTVKGNDAGGIKNVSVSGNQIAQRLENTSLNVDNRVGNVSYRDADGNIQSTVATAETPSSHTVIFYRGAINESNRAQSVTAIHESFHQMPQLSQWSSGANTVTHQQPFTDAARAALDAE